MNKEIREALNRHVVGELDAFYLYMQMASWFEANRLGGFARLMRQQAHEEVSHAQTIFNYLNECGGGVTLGQIAAQKYRFTTVREIMAQVIAQGRAIAGAIHRLLDMAESAGDANCRVLLTWLASVQLHEEAVMVDIIERVNGIAHDGGDTLFELDKELVSRRYSSPAPLHIPAKPSSLVG